MGGFYALFLTCYQCHSHAVVAWIHAVCLAGQKAAWQNGYACLGMQV